jgi:hypothetical protein
MALKVCSCTGCPAHPGSCPELTTTRRCPACTTTADRARGSRQDRGYDAAHTRERERWRPHVERGDVDCAAPTCVMPERRIQPGQPWDLGHTDDRSTWRGPEHAACNRGWRRGR